MPHPIGEHQLPSTAGLERDTSSQANFRLLKGSKITEGGPANVRFSFAVEDSLNSLLPHLPSCLKQKFRRTIRPCLQQVVPDLDGIFDGRPVRNGM